jgi:hypothetical protein
MKNWTSFSAPTAQPRRLQRIFGICGLCLPGMLCGCDVESKDDGESSGVDFGGGGEGGEDDSSAGGDAVSDAGASGQANAPSCDRGVAVVMTDYSSTNVGILDLEGAVLAPSIVSSGSAKPGLTQALSGDIDVPRTAPRSGRLVLLDRFGTNVTTWIDPTTADVLAQLPIGTGFESNPYDYYEYSSDRAMVARFGSNPSPGAEDFDGGGDLLLIDTNRFMIVGRIAMPEEDDTLLPRPSFITPFGETAVVTLGRLSSDFAAAGEGRLVGVSTTKETISWTITLEGVKNCGRLAVAPSGEIGAVACSGSLNPDTWEYVPEESDIVILDLTETPPVELRRFGIGRRLETGLQMDLEFASETQLLSLAYPGGDASGDQVLSVAVEDGNHEILHTTSSPYTIGGVTCAPGCSDICLVTDAEEGVVRRFLVTESGGFEILPSVAVDTAIGLPPRRLGAL